MSVVIPSELHPEFVAGGWSASRRVSPPPELVSAVRADHPAVQILSAFSALRVGESGRGEECATSDIDFRWPGPQDDDDIAWWEQALDTQLVCVGEYHNGHGALYFGSDGRCFGLSLIHDLFTLEGDSFGVAAVRLIRGRCARPMLRADQNVVMMYGIDYTRDSAEVYWPKPEPP